MSRKPPLRNAAAVIGMGTKLVTQDDPKINSLQLQLYACHDAIKAAGVDRHQIGAVYTCRAPMGYTALQWNLRIVQELKIVPTLTSEITVHGAGVLGTLAHAAMAVHSGAVDYALCCSGCTGPLCSGFLPACCAASAAISPTSFCSVDSGCCRTRR